MDNELPISTGRLIAYLAEWTGKPLTRIVELMESGKLPQPIYMVEDGRRIAWYSPDVMRRVVKAYNQYESLVSMADLAARTGLTYDALKRHIEDGLIDPPSHTNRKRLAYTEEEAERIVRLAPELPKHRPGVNKVVPIRQTNGLASRQQMAKRCGVSNTTMVHYISRGKLPKPTETVPSSNGRYYNKRTQQQIESFFAHRPKRAMVAAAARKAAGWYSKVDLAQELDVSRAHVAALIDSGLVAAPTHKPKGHQQINCYYNKEEFDEALEDARKAIVVAA